MVQYTPLEPSSFQALDLPTPTFDGSTASFFATSTFIYMLLFSAILAAAFYQYILVGVYRMEASESGIRKSNETFKRATLGLLGCLSLFLIISALNSSLLTGDVDLGKFKAGQIAITQQQTSGGQSGGQNYTARVASHAATLGRLTAVNIHTNHNDKPCTEAQFSESTPSCTNLAYLPEETIQMLLKLSRECACTIVITGGTEPGHVSHGEYRRPVDLQLQSSNKLSSPVYAFIKRVTNDMGPSRNCYAQYAYSSFTFCDELPPTPTPSTWAPHFHVF